MFTGYERQRIAKTGFIKICIIYIFTYHIYGYSFKFSDVYSQSSLKAYLVSLENWFASQYIELYREQDISILDNSDDVEIDDQTYKTKKYYIKK